MAITQTADLVRIEIEDKGCGFDPAAVPGDCFGLVAMRARAAMLQGAVRITSRPGEGTLVVAEIPTAERMLYYVMSGTRLAAPGATLLSAAVARR